VAIDPNSLPRDAETLRKIVVDLAEQLDRSVAEQNKYQTLLREPLEAQRNRKSEQLSKEQLALFEVSWQAHNAEAESAAGEDDDDLDNAAGPVQKPNETPKQKRGGRQPLARHLKREPTISPPTSIFVMSVALNPRAARGLISLHPGVGRDLRQYLHIP
jgi:hypothetical protein